MCYSPAPPSREASPEGLLMYLCVKCSRRTQYEIKPAAESQNQGLLSRLLEKRTPPPPSGLPIKRADAETILKTVYPNRRVMERLGPSITMDEADFCPFCRPEAQNPHVRVTYTCSICKRETVCHLDTNEESPPITVGMDVRMHNTDFARWFLDLEQAKANLPELGADFGVETTGLCLSCGKGQKAKWQLIWNLGEGDSKIIPVEAITFELLKKFVTALDLPPEEQPNWEGWEIKAIERAFQG